MELSAAGFHLSRRALLGAMASAGLTGPLLLESIAWAPAASATSYVQYQLPFPLTDPANQYYNPWVNGGHSGYDFNNGVGRGDAIGAVADGEVCHSQADPNNENARGHRIELMHADGAYSAYCHMRDAPALAIGTQVLRGETVGYVGNSGYVPGKIIGNHLHLGMSMSDDSAINGTGTMDPIQYIQDRLASAPSNEEEEDTMGVMYYASGPTGTTAYTTIASTTSSGAAHAGGTVVGVGSLWFQECPGAPLYPMSAGANYYNNPAFNLEYEGWADQRPTASRNQAALPSAVGKLIEARGTTVQPIGNFA